jgi:hypothetical protein
LRGGGAPGRRLAIRFPSARAYSRQVRYIDRLVGLIPQAEPDTKRGEAILTLSALAGVVAMARAVDDPELSGEILTRTANALHRRAHEAAG